MSWKVLIGGTNKNSWVSEGLGGATIPTEVDFVAYTSGLSISVIGISGVSLRPITGIVDSSGDLLFTVASVAQWATGQPFDKSIIRITGTADPVYWNYLKDESYYVIEFVSGTNFKLKEFSLGTDYQFVELDNYGVKPYYLDEGDSYNYFGGGYKKLNSGRLAFEFTPKQFRTQGSAGQIQPHSLYWDLINVLRKRNIYILEFGSEFERINALNNTLPMLVDTYDLGELSDDFANNQSSIGMTLVKRTLL